MVSLAPRRIAKRLTEVLAAGDHRGLAKLLHHDPVALDFVQIKLDRCGCLGRRHIGGFDRTEDFALVRSRTTRQRRFIRPASVAGLSFLLERRGAWRQI